MTRFVLRALALIAAGCDHVGAGRRPQLRHARALYRSTSRSTPIAGPVPISAAISAMPGARSTMPPTKPSGFAGGVQAGYNWQNGAMGVRPRGRHPGERRRRHLRALEILQPLVRHGARPRRLRLQQHAVLRHRRSCLRRIARRRPSACRNPTPMPAGPRGVGAEMGFAPNWSAKIEYLYVDLANSNFVITGASNGYRLRHGPRRRELPLLRSKTKLAGYNLPAGRKRPGFFCPLGITANTQRSERGSTRPAELHRQNLIPLSARASAHDEITRLTALGPLPFLSGSTSNVMRCPSVRSFNPARSTAVI